MNFPTYFDIHSHLHFPAYDVDRDEVIKRSLDNGVWTVNVGTNKKTSESAVKLSEKYKEGVYATVGLHPIHTDNTFCDAPSSSCHSREGQPDKVILAGGNPDYETEFDYDYYKKLAEHPKVVAIGECGLDFFHLDEGSKQKQIEIFEKHIELSLEMNKPLMLHIRNAYDEVLDILDTRYKIQDSNLIGNVHFFAGTLEHAKKFLNLGFSLSFTGVITYPRTKTSPDYEEIIKMAPLNMIMAETDAPYVAPNPYRGKRNESLYVIEVVKKIAEIKNMPREIVAEALLQNSLKFLHL